MFPCGHVNRLDSVLFSKSSVTQPLVVERRMKDLSRS